VCVCVCVCVCVGGVVLCRCACVCPVDLIRMTNSQMYPRFISTSRGTVVHKGAL